MRWGQLDWGLNLFVILFVLLNFLFANSAKAEGGACLSAYKDGVKSCVAANKSSDCAPGTTFITDWKLCELTEKEVFESKKGLSALKKSVDKLTTSGKATKPLEEVIGGYIKTALILVGVLFTALTFYGGYIWFIARDDEEEAKRAKSIISMALIGLIIVLAAYFVTYFIIYRLTVASGTGL